MFISLVYDEEQSQSFIFVNQTILLCIIYVSHETFSTGLEIAEKHGHGFSLFYDRQMLGIVCEPLLD